MAEPKIKVRITAKETITLDKVVEISARDFSEYQQACENDVGENWFSEFADRYLDPLNDVVDGGEYEDVQVTKIP